MLFFLLVAVGLLAVGYWQREHPVLLAACGILAFGLTMLGIYLYARWIPCKLRENEVEHLAHAPPDHIGARHVFVARMGKIYFFCICPRCAGAWVGILVFIPVILLNRFLFGFYVLPEWWTILLALGVSLSFVPAVHGTLRRRRVHAQLPPEGPTRVHVLHSELFLWLSGFLVAFGGFLVSFVIMSMKEVEGGIMDGVLELVLPGDN